MTKAEIQQVKLRFGIIGNNEALMRAIDIAIQVAPTDLSVLITGESGVGKESFPQIILRENIVQSVCLVIILHNKVQWVFLAAFDQCTVQVQHHDGVLTYLRFRFRG